MKISHALFTAVLLTGYNAVAQLDFKNIELIPTRGSTYAVKAGDFNGDGAQDIVFCATADTKSYVLFNEGNSLSSVPVVVNPELTGLIPGATYDTPLAIGNFDSDSKDEIAVYDNISLKSTKRITIYKYDGVKFNAIKTLDASPVAVYNMSSSDLNKDGKSDLVFVSDKVYEYESNASGGYTLKTPQTPEITPYRSYLADIDNDTWPDLILNDLNFKVSIFKNNGNGGFTPDQDIPASGSNIKKMIIADFNNDNNKDVIIEFWNTPGFLDYWKQSPAGVFTNTRIDVIPTMATGMGMSSFDQNHDGKPDLILGASMDNPITRTGFAVLQNNGVGFDVSFHTEPGLNVADVLCVDLGNDGQKEIISANIGNNILVHEDINSLFTEKQNIPYSFASMAAIAQDMNLDGLDDIVTVNSYSKTLSVLYNTIQGDFQKPEYYFCSAVPASVASADFNEDGFPDLVYSVQDKDIIGAILSRADGTLGQPVEMAGLSGRKIIVADFNNDGHQDFFHGAVYFGYGDGTFQPYYLNLSLIDYASADYDHDGFDDLVYSSTSGLSILWGKNDYSLNPGPNILSVKIVDQLVAAEVTHDQYIDIMASNRDGSVSQFTNSTNGSFTEKSITAPGVEGGGLIVADFNLDNLPDLAVIASYTSMSVLTGNANGTFSLYKNFSLEPVYNNRILLMKRNGDAKPDLLLPFNLAVLVNDFIAKPLQAPSSFVFSEVTDTSAKIAFQKGDGNGRLVVLRESPNLSALPVDNTFYVPDTKFGSGNTPGTSNFAVMSSDGTTVTISGLRQGTAYTVTAFEFNANAKKTIINYLTSSSGSANFTTKKTQVITAPPITAKMENDMPFAITPTASSMLPVAIQLISGGVTLSNSIFTITSPGPIRLKFSQDGDDVYAPAPDVDYSFCINPKIPTITSEISGPGKYLLTSSSDQNNNWLRNGTFIPGATGKTLEPSRDGIYVVKVDYSNCFSLSLPTSNLITAINNNETSHLLYPNPATRKVFIEVAEKNEPPKKIMVYDMLGHEKNIHHDFNDGLLNLDVEDLAPGIYVVLVQTNHEVLSFTVWKK